ncbi:MAG: DUF4136 domain-containing protein [Gammaproteobacteria bacterium]|jgi:hypothetical protein
MKLTGPVLPPLVLWLLAGCASVTEDIRVQTEADPGLDLGSYRTYSWLGATEIAPVRLGDWEPPGLDADAEIRALLNRELRRRGMREVDSDAQLVVGFGAGINPEVFEIVEDPDSKMYTLHNAPRAALVVVFIDPRTRRPVWVGTAVGDVKAGRSAHEVRRRIDYAVTSMLRQAPR